MPNQGLGLPYIMPYKTDSFGQSVKLRADPTSNENTLLCHDTSTHTATTTSLISAQFQVRSCLGAGREQLVKHPAAFRANPKQYLPLCALGPCLGRPSYNSAGTPVNAMGHGRVIPNSTSGIGDRRAGPHGDTRFVAPRTSLLTTRWGVYWCSPVPWMHEFGHNLDLSHAGWSPTPTVCQTIPA